MAGQDGLHFDGHSRGSMTIGNAMESMDVILLPTYASRRFPYANMRGFDLARRARYRNHRLRGDASL
jgi:hypothetical protein